MSFHSRLLLFCLWTTATAVSTRASSVQFRSGPAEVSLLELYTSEGCSSCPPAEKWLGDLRTEKGLWTEFVPVAFHVNYWDHLGWRDALASPAFTARERAYAAAWGASSVYTPCFVLNGSEWKPRGRIPLPGRRAKDAGEMTLAWSATGRSAEVDYRPPGPVALNSPLEVSVALLGGGIVNRIRQGENAGRELPHEFVVLEMTRASLRRADGGNWHASLTLPMSDERAASPAPRHALAAWVSQAGQLAPLQAVGGWLR